MGNLQETSILLVKNLFNLMQCLEQLGTVRIHCLCEEFFVALLLVLWQSKNNIDHI